MADSVLFIGWNRSVKGREQQAMQLFPESDCVGSITSLLMKKY